MNAANRYFVSVFAILALSTLVSVVGTSSGAADRDPETAKFTITCETSEPEFYDWVQASLWKKSRRFRRDLDSAIDALVSDPNWTIRVADPKCTHSAMVTDRRESLVFMIEDAHTEGAGTILYGRD